MATKGKSGGRTIPTGAHVSGNYRSGHFKGTVTGIYKKGTTSATTGYSIKPDASSRHPGEPARIHRLGKNLRRS